ncbi:signal recognition particle 9 kDa protein-domain-containing protein [Penicillium maclennaniae]|uniref:signal recognition particle 9 kDa protein-domain-containing protein n=1 Tax=Penicillium maclennaniae TaxID=1343394 RepID=UPI002541842A|nr:signal recognition particle 9 kDa protein-domain-containing protein [Penicillium maclennaniae]KAJ5678025.1 signal recognition particle 9 kDa protein-domain-containing protein [Penicillium maclennaniae]
MPYLTTSQEYLEQSALLLEAYPDSRITTKYSYPTERPSEKAHRAKSTRAETESTPSAPVAALELKTFNAESGICLKYRTNKAAEVSRLMTGLGKLASGADVASLGVSGPADVEMVDAPAVEESKGAAQGPGQGQAQGGKGKKKGGKGKR